MSPPAPGNVPPQGHSFSSSTDPTIPAQIPVSLGWDLAPQKELMVLCLSLPAVNWG